MTAPLPRRPGLLTTRETALILGVSEETIAQWWRNGRIEAAEPPAGNRPRMFTKETVQRLAGEFPKPKPPPPALDPRPWEDNAACKGMDPDRFFESHGGEWPLLKAVCARCPVRAMCLDFALSIERGLPTATVYGLYGGLVADERVAILAAERLEAAA